MNLKEFFVHKLQEGPGDPTFKKAPEIPVDDPTVDPGIDPAGAGGDPDANPMMTQDVSKMSASSLQFFTKNVQSAVSKYNLEQEGFDAGALEQFAGAIDSMVQQMYEQVQEPAERQSFESDYQTVAAKWSESLTKLFDQLLKLKSHAQPY